MSDDNAQILDHFVHEWSRFHGAATPIEFYTSTHRRAPWVRFHALPNSKRYAENQSERQEVLRRANILGTEILGADTPCWLVKFVIEESEPMVQPPPVKPDASLRYNYGEDGFYWKASVSSVRWQERIFEDLLFEIADDNGPPFWKWISRFDGAIIAPYDGGFDLFPTSHAKVDWFKRRYPEWLSNRTDGL